MSLVLADAGFKTFGIGRTPAKINKLKNGRMLFREEGAESLLKKHLNKRFFPTVSYKVIKKVEVIVLTLGTPIDPNMNPVLNQIDQALDLMLPFLKENQLIILRSTISPETTLYVKEKIEIATNFKIGENLFLAFCPERVAEGNSIREIKEIPQIIGGIDPKSSQRAKDFFSVFNSFCLITDATSAELAKLFSNMYRYISFAIANEFMVISQKYKRSIHDITNLVNYKYKRGGLALPGFAGGPCLFKDGFFLINDNPYLDLITASWKINESIPLFLIDQLKQRVDLGRKKITILGMAFKPEVDDTRESLSFKLKKALKRNHANIKMHDPYVKNDVNTYGKLFKNLSKADIIIIATRHEQYYEMKSQILDSININAIICDIWNIFGTGNLIFEARELKNNKKSKNGFKNAANSANHNKTKENTQLLSETI